MPTRLEASALRRRARGLAILVVLAAAVDLGGAALAERRHPSTLEPGSPASTYRMRSPLYHHDLRPNVCATEAWNTRRVPICTNSLGFRDRAPREIPLRARGRRVLLLGDSVTEGLGVAYADTFAGLLDARLARHGVEVLNGAAVSYSPSIYERKTRYLVEERGLALDEVVVFLDISDIEDEALYYATDEHGNVVDAPEAPPNAAMRSNWGASAAVPLRPWWSWSLTTRGLHALKDAVYGSGDWRPAIVGGSKPALDALATSPRASWTFDDETYERFGRAGLERCRAALGRLRELLERRGARLTLVVYPWPAQILAHDRDSRQVRYWRGWAAEHGVAFVDLFPLLLTDGDPWEVIRVHYLPFDVHLSELGHRRVAQAVSEVLEAHARDAAPRVGEPPR
ncbi:MAG: GDSL-type esterase/lipase family protein [bacterium]